MEYQNLNAEEREAITERLDFCLLYTSDAADEL